MTEDQVIEVVNVLILAAFTFLLVIGFLTTLIRRFGLILKRIPAPRLLPRDLTLLGTLSWPFALILLVRAEELTRVVVGQLWWVLLTGIPPVFGVAVYVYYEIFVIGQPEDWRVVIKSLIRRVVHRG